MTKGILISRANYPVTVSLGEHEMVVSPRAQVEIENVELLPNTLPKELVLRVN